MEKLTKTLKIVWLINGFVFILFAIVLLVTLYNERSSRYDYEPDFILTDNELKDAKEKGLYLQGLQYDYPTSIFNSDYRYMEVRAMTYEEPLEELALSIASAGDISPNLYSSMLNLVFMDENYNDVHSLLDTKGNIAKVLVVDAYDAERDKNADKVKHMAYLIGFKDSNGDGFLNYEDEHDLYISDLMGRNLMQVTMGIDVKDFYFRDAYTKLFIEYEERDDVKPEHKRKRFAIYDISKKELSFLVQLDSELDKLEDILRN